MRLALYTTIYPAVLPFLPAWVRSVEAQTDSDFEVWIGVDALAPEEVEGHPVAALKPHWVMAQPGDTPTGVRQRAIEKLIPGYDAVIFVDSDDVLHPSRVAAARASLKNADVGACALRLVDEAGTHLGAALTLAPDETPDEVLPRTNSFGLSNTVYRTDVLQACLPAPAETVALDWLLVTRAWLRGACLAFDRTPRMDYRQHGQNIASVLPPFTPAKVIYHTAVVQAHFQAMLSHPSANNHPERLVRVQAAAAEVDVFEKTIVQDQTRLKVYCERLTVLAPAPRWWAAVAHPALRAMWSKAVHT